jgi:outer membrane protein OmpA-like peptidoglycan-associated protein
LAWQFAFAQTAQGKGLSMAEDWLTDVRKYAAKADENVVSAIVKYLGIALRNRDSSLVSFSDPEEVGRVREKFLRKKLALTDPDSVLNEGLDWVKGLMSGDRTKNRVTVYYLLAHYFGKLDLFGGAAGTTAASLGGAAAGPGAAAIAGSGSESASAADTSARSDNIRPSYAANVNSDDEAASGGWPSWLTWLLLALAVAALFLLFRSCSAEKPAATNVVSNEATTGVESNIATEANAAATNVAAEAAVPTGAGVISGTQDNKPMLTIYFDSGKSDVSTDLAAAAGTLKAYLDANPGAKLAVSGYNDPSGNAAFNAELSKKRAQGVAAALAAAGISASSVELVKPPETTTATVTPDQARRVEVTVK